MQSACITSDNIPVQKYALAMNFEVLYKRFYCSGSIGRAIALICVMGKLYSVEYGIAE